MTNLINPQNDQKDLFKFVDKLAKNLNRYIGFSEDRGNDGKPSSAIYSLQKLTGANFIAHYVLLLAAADLPTPLFDQFVAQLENLFFYYIFTKTPIKDLGDRIFPPWAR